MFASVTGCLSVCRLNYTELGRRSSFRVVYADIMYTVVTFILPFIVLTIFSLLLIRVYRAQRRRRAAMMTPRGSNRNKSSTTSVMSASANDEHSVTRVIVVVMVVFAVCNLPAKVFDNAYRSRPICGTLAYVARRLSFVLEVANSTANFVVYCALRHQFRDGLRRALSPLRRGRTEADGSGRRGGLQRQARSASPIDLEQRNIDFDAVGQVPHGNLDVPSVLLERNTA